jgi:hypothetical protein
MAPFIFKFASEYSVTKYQKHQEGVELKKIPGVLLYADVNLLSQDINTMKKTMKFY